MTTPRPQTASRIAALLFIIAAILVTGCSGSRGSMFEKDDDRDPIDVALASAAPDERRMGVQRLSESKDGATPWAVDIYRTMAREDVDDMVRHAALLALDKHDATTARRIIADLLNNPKAPRVQTTSSTDIRPAGPVLRRGAARLLLRYVRSGASTDEINLAQITCTALEDERDHQTRILLLDTMGFVPERTVLTALIEAMRRDDFAEKRAAEDSLIRLTGETHRYDADAWQAWLAKTNAPFAKAGQTPAGHEQPDDGKWWNIFD